MARGETGTGGTGAANQRLSGDDWDKLGCKAGGIGDV